MANIIIVSVSAIKSSSLFMAIVDNGKLNIIKTWGKASYPIPASLVMDKETNALEMFKACGISCYDVKTQLDYANNIFSDDKELAKLNALVFGKPATVVASKPATVAVQAPIVSIEHDAQDVPTTLSDALSDYDKKAINFKAFRATCLSEGMPEKLTSPNAVCHWARAQVVAQPSHTQATPASEATPAQAPQAQAVDNDLMAQFQQFQIFLAMQAAQAK